MSPQSLSRRLLGTLIAAAFAFVTLPGTALGTERIESIDLPSTHGNVPLRSVPLNKVTSLKATVLLPDGYDADPDRRWPVLYLLAGIGDNTTGWITSGQIHRIAERTPAIIVLPESGRGFLMDFWRGGSRRGPNWMRYTLDEVVPAIESRYRVRPGRQWHAIGGISMGAYGALQLAGQLPGYFGTVMSLSALVDSQSPEAYLVLPTDMRAGSYEAVWGPINGPYARVNNPLRTISNIAHTRMYLHVGRASVDPRVPFNLRSATEGWLIELLAADENRRYHRALVRAGVPHEWATRVGVHDWPYWRREVPRAMAWGLFEPPPYAGFAAATSWSYQTMAPHGNAWGVGYRFATPPRDIVTITRNGDTLTIRGTGEITIAPGAAAWNASGQGSRPACTFTATLPAVRVLPAECFADAT